MNLDNRHVGRLYPAGIALSAFAVSAVFCLAIMTRGVDNAFPVEWAWREFLTSIRSPAFTTVALFLNTVGGTVWGGFIIPFSLTVALALHRRYMDCGILVVSLGASVAVVQSIKHLVLRERPPEMMVTSDVGSFPSGHVANAATTAVVMALLLRKAWLWVVGTLYVIAMIVSRCYLSVHWLGDTICGALLGGGVALLIWWMAMRLTQLPRAISGKEA